MRRGSWLCFILLAGCGSNPNLTSLDSSSGPISPQDSSPASIVASRTLTSSALTYLNRATQGEAQLGRRPLGANRYLVFQASRALIPEDTNAFSDIYLRDLRTGRLSLVSKSSSGQVGNGNSSQASISADGRYVVFVSLANNLIASDRNAQPDIFWRDLKTGQVQRVNVGVAGQEANRISQAPVVSRGGRWVAFSSPASNLVAGDSNAVSDVFVRDLQQATTLWVSQGLTGSCWEVDLTPDGSTLAFAHQISAEERQIVRCLRTEPSRRFAVSRSAAGVAADDQCFGPSLSDDGKKVGFYSLARNLVPQSLDGSFFNCFVQDQNTQAIVCLSLNRSGAQANGHSGLVSLAGDGLSASFASEASDLVVADSNLTSDVFSWTAQRGVERASCTTAGVQGHGHSRQSALAPDGRLLVFSSHANNLVGSDPDHKFDIFLRDRHLGRTSLASPVCRRPGSPFAGWQGARGQAPSRYVLTRTDVGNPTQADLDGDGDLDFAAAGKYTLNLMWNQGQGTFVWSNSVDGRSQDGKEIVAVDFDGDGDQDLVSSSSNSLEILAHDNYGGGRFVSGDFRNASGGRLALFDAQGLVTGDWDRDGDFDWGFSEGFVGNEYRIFLPFNQGNGDFDRMLRLIPDSKSVFNLAKDIDGDGDSDLVAAQEADRSLRIFFNNGSGEFSQSLRLPCAGQPVALAAGDLDGDGRLDLVTAEKGTQGCSCFFGTGQGGFSQATFKALSREPKSVAVADLDNNGRLEVALASPGKAVLLAAQGRNLNQVSEFRIGGSGPLFFDDYNGDGRLDVMGFEAAAESAGVYLNQGNLQFSEPLALDSTLGNDSGASGDLDGDGQLDLVSADSGQPRLLRFFQNARAQWNGPLPLSTSSQSPGIKLCQDLDRDGDLDLLVAHSTEHSLQVLLNNGLGEFQTLPVLPGSKNDYSPGVSAADLDGDEDLDLVTCRIQSVVGYFNDGRGNFASPVTLHRMGVGEIEPQTADFDGDGDQDIVALGVQTPRVELGINNGSGNFTFQPPGQGQYWYLDFEAGDLDQDGDQDLCLLGVDSYSGPPDRLGRILKIWLNDGRGQWTVLPEQTAPWSYDKVRLEDVDADGDLDVLTGGSGVALFVNQGQARFAAPICSGGLKGWPNLGDFDNDGDLDVASAKDGLAWLKNLTNP